jgi:hypothetical protein
MLRIKTNPCYFVLLSLLLLIACNERATTSEENNRDTPVTVTNRDISDTPPMPAYDPAMDAINTGAKFAKKLVDTLNVKMYEFAVKPGESWPLHSHPDHTVYVLQGGKIALFNKDAGRHDTLTIPTGSGFLVGGPATDSGRNIGKTTIKMVVHDIYRPRGR